MKIIKLTALLLAFLVFNTTLKAQVNDIWIKTPPLGMIPYPAPYFKASIELDITEGQFVDNRPLIRVSGLENVGGTVNRNVMLFMKPSGILGIGTSNPTSLLHLNKSTVK